MDAPIRICQLTPCLWSGGTEERIARITAGFDRHRLQSHWIGFGPIREALIEGSGMRATAVERNPSRGIQPDVVLRLARTLRRRRPHVLHVHNWSTSLYGIAAARLAGVPKVIFGMGGQDNTDPPPPRRQALMRALAPHVDLYTSVCEYLGQDLLQYWGAPSDRLRVIKTGIDLDADDDAPTREALRAEIGVDPQAQVIGAISVLRPVKRMQDLIAAAGILARQHSKLHLVLIGNALGVSMDDLRAQATAVGLGDRLHLLGRVQAPARYLRLFDVFVNCSDFEGTSNALLEAMAARIPVVATAVGGNPELVQAEQTGLLVPPRDPPPLAEAIHRLLEDAPLRDAVTAAARAKVEAEHSFDAMIQTYAQMYLELAEAPNDFRPLPALVASLKALTAGARA